MYNTTKTITLKISEPGTIYYTLNGSTPTTSSTVYNVPITISTTTTLEYLAVDLATNKFPIYKQTYTINKIPPKVSTTNPTNQKTGVSKTSTITIKFIENIKNSTNYNKITVKNSAGKTINITKIISGTTISIKTSTKTANTWYTVTIPGAAISDMAGNNLQTTYTFKSKQENKNFQFFPIFF